MNNNLKKVITVSGVLASVGLVLSAISSYQMNKTIKKLDNDAKVLKKFNNALLNK